MPRPVIAVSIVVAVIIAAGLVFMRPASSPRTVAGASETTLPAPPSTEAPTSTTTTSTSAAPATTSTTVDPGSLPQTHDKPSGADPAFVARMQLLVQSVASGDTSVALPAFFPQTAYDQVKAVANPTADWKYRLVSLFDQDITAMHRSFGSAASSVAFVGVDVPDATAQWVNPGAEYNRIGYWRVYNTRVRYMVGTKPGSFIVISLISWRGQWYVVHFRTPPK